MFCTDKVIKLENLKSVQPNKLQMEECFFSLFCCNISLSIEHCVSRFVLICLLNQYSKEANT